MIEQFDLENLVRENVRRMKAYSSARDEFKQDGREMTFLDANENPFDNGVNRYPDPQQSKLKSRLAALKGVKTFNILLGNGSDEVLDLVFRAFCEPKQSNVITLPPTYGMYKVLANLNDVEEREVLLKKNFEPDVELIFESVNNNTRIIFLCSPNNPTGNTFSEDTVLQILKKFSGLVVIDEAYIDFSGQESWLERLEDFPNLIVTQTLSKAYGLAGVRLGICYASEEIIQILNKIKPPYNVNELTQRRAEQRLQNQDSVEKEIERILEQREHLIKELPKIPFLEGIYPSDANFILAKVDDADLRYRQLLEKGVVVRNRSNQPLCENSIRFTVGTTEENELLLKALKEISE